MKQNLIQMSQQNAERYAEQALEHIISDPDRHEHCMRQALEWQELAELLTRHALLGEER